MTRVAGKKSTKMMGKKYPKKSASNKNANHDNLEEGNFHISTFEGSAVGLIKNHISTLSLLSIKDILFEWKQHSRKFEFGLMINFGFEGQR